MSDLYKEKNKINRVRAIYYRNLKFEKIYQLFAHFMLGAVWDILWSSKSA